MFKSILILSATTSILFSSDINPKALEIESFANQSRISIIQKADQCTKSAKTQEDVKSCRQSEKQSLEQLHAELKEKRKKKN